MNPADLPWHPMDDAPTSGTWVVALADFASAAAFITNEPCLYPKAKGWLTLTEFDKLINGEDAGI